MVCAVRVMSPEFPVDKSFRCAVALLALVTTRLDTVTFCPTEIVSSAKSVRLPAFQLVPLALLVPPVAVVSRSKSAEMTIFAGSIRTAPSCPSEADADSLPPASSTVCLAENSTNPASPLEPALALILAPVPSRAALSAITVTVPPSLLAPTPSADTRAPRSSAISLPAAKSIVPAFSLAEPLAKTVPETVTSFRASKSMVGESTKRSTTSVGARLLSKLTRSEISMRAVSPVLMLPEIEISPALMTASSTALTLPLTVMMPARDNGTPLARTRFKAVGLITLPGPNIWSRN